MNLTKRLRYLVSLISLLVFIFAGTVAVNAEVFDYSMVEETTTSVEDGQTFANGQITLGDAKSMVATQASYIQQFSGCSPEEWEYVGEVMSSQTTLFADFAKVIGDTDCGAYRGYGDVTVEETDDPNSIKVISVLEFENNAYKMTINVTCFELLGPQMVSTEFSLASEGEETFGQKMASAAGNTLMGMGTVFIVLIFISLIISAFAFIPKITAKMEEKKANKESVKVEEQSVSTETIKPVENDTELIAVIAAAIAASEQVSTDSFVVRSIRRR